MCVWDSWGFLASCTLWWARCWQGWRNTREKWVISTRKRSGLPLRRSIWNSLIQSESTSSASESTTISKTALREPRSSNRSVVVCMKMRLRTTRKTKRKKKTRRKLRSGTRSSLKIPTWSKWWITQVSMQKRQNLNQKKNKRKHRKSPARPRIRISPQVWQSSPFQILKLSSPLPAPSLSMYPADRLFSDWSCDIKTWWKRRDWTMEASRCSSRMWRADTT